MSTNLQSLLRQALLNNTYDYNVLHDTLKNTWTNSFASLYQLQKSIIGYDEHVYFSGDEFSREVENIGHLYLNKYGNACFDIDYDFIHVCNREEFKRSKFFMSDFSFTDMVDNPQIFHKLPIVMIDDQVIWDYKLSTRKESFTIVLPYGRRFVVSKDLKDDEIIYLDHKIQVLIVDNVMYDRITVNKNLVLKARSNTLTIDTQWLHTMPTKKEGIYFISIHIPNDIGEGYELGTSLLPCVYENNKLICQLTDTDLSLVNKWSKNFYISVIFINRLQHHMMYTGLPYTTCFDDECGIFILQREECVPYSMPVPIENLMIIRERDNHRVYLRNIEAVELFYPNIYHIKDPDHQDGDKYYIYYFYKYSDALKYTPLHDFYYNFLKLRFKGEYLEGIVDKLYRLCPEDSFILFQDDEAIEGINNIDELIALCGDSTMLPEAEYILVCGDAEIAFGSWFLEPFVNLIKYGYLIHRYGEIDFVKNYLLDEDNIGKDPIEYKDEKLRRWIDEDPNVLREYVLAQNKLYDSTYHLWTKSINLDSRLRTDTRTEMGEDGTNLPEECYVFAFRNDNTTSGKLLNLRIFVDGIYAIGVTQIRHYFTDYLYIPKKLVTADSYIEVEILPSYEYSKKLHFTSMDDEVHIDLLEPEDKIYPTAEDMYYITPTGHMYNILPPSGTEITPSTGGDTIKARSTEAVSMIVNGITYDETEMYDSALFELTAEYKNGNFVVETTDEENPVKFTRLNKFTIRPQSEAILNKDVIFCISKAPRILEVLITDSMYPSISLVGHNFKFDGEYLRVFKNGRLLSRNQYIFTYSYSFPRITFITPLEKGDIIYVDITPYKYKEIFSQERIIEADRVIIDLQGYIDKPFDVRYYDVYLNGRKLSLNNVFAISPWRIALVNTHSTYDLQIYEKERDYEYFGTEFKDHQYFYTVDDLLDSAFIYDDEIETVIDQIIDSKKDKNLTIKPNDNCEERNNSDTSYATGAITYIFYRDELIPKQFINPDHLLFNKTYVESSFPLISETYQSKPSDLCRNDAEYERRKNYESVLMLDPDILFEGSYIADTEHVIYAAGHIDEVSDDMLNEDIDNIE